jgi:hypothetical protein
MATIIEFYKPTSFQDYPVWVPPPERGKVLPFPSYDADNTPAPDPLETMGIRIMFAGNTKPARLLPEEVISARGYFAVQPVRANKSRTCRSLNNTCGIAPTNTPRNQPACTATALSVMNLGAAPKIPAFVTLSRWSYTLTA